jgi:hypothetical protein
MGNISKMSKVANQVTEVDRADFESKNEQFGRITKKETLSFGRK